MEMDKNHFLKEKFEKAKEEMVVPYFAFKWDSGFFVISQREFNKLSAHERNILLKSANPGGDRKNGKNK